MFINVRQNRGTLQSGFMLVILLASSLSACGGGESSSKAVTASEKAPSYTGANRSLDADVAGSAGTTDSAAQPEVAAEPDFDLVGTYQRACISCHLTGAQNAPKTHDVEAWAPRMAKGDAALLQTINSGLNGMPPKGLCFDCTDEQFLALTEFMASAKP